MSALLELTDISKSYEAAGQVLSAVNLAVQAGETLAITGESGCGKSTLLNIIGTLDDPDSGSVCFEGNSLDGLSEQQRTQLRSLKMGWIFQMHHLLPQCTALENVLLPAVPLGKISSQTRQRAEQLLDRVGLSARSNFLPSRLSGGERQRVAVARALINKPALLLADEPTGSLSSSGSAELVELLLLLNREEHLTLLVVTHAPAVAAAMDRRLVLESGVLHPAD